MVEQQGDELTDFLFICKCVLWTTHALHQTSVLVNEGLRGHFMDVIMPKNGHWEHIETSLARIYVKKSDSPGRYIFLFKILIFNGLHFLWFRRLLTLSFLIVLNRPLNF